MVRSKYGGFGVDTGREGLPVRVGLNEGLFGQIGRGGGRIFVNYIGGVMGKG